MTHRWSLALALGSVLVLFAPLLSRGDVLLAEDLASKWSLLAPPAAERGARPMRDQSNAFLPELAHQLSDRREGWLSTWNPHTELGRPDWHTSGLTRAFLPTYVGALFIDDPYVLYTVLVLLAELLTVAFGYGLLRRLGLHPAACCAGAVLLGLGYYMTYWLTFLLYLWGVCWTLALILATLRFLERADTLRGLGVAFAAHALLLTAYPQQVVWHAWLLAVVGLVALLRSEQRPSPRHLTMLGACLALGAASTLPVFMDLAVAARRSTRLAPDFEFFLQPLPALSSFDRVAAWLAALVEPFWFGHPFKFPYRIELRGVSFGPLASMLAALALLPSLARRLWPWLVVPAYALVATACEPAFRFGVDHLGLHVSRHAPLAVAHVPIALAAACAGDHILRREAPAPWRWVALALVPVTLATPGFAGPFARPDTLTVITTGAVLIAGVAFLRTRRPELLLGAAGSAALLAGFRLIPSQPLSGLREKPRFARMIEAAVPGGTRYAWIGPEGGGVFYPNQEVLLGLHSIHTYNSLSSRGYQTWVRRAFGLELLKHGRTFPRVPDEARYDADELALAGIGLWVSAVDLPSEFATPVDRFRGMGLYHPRFEPVIELLVDRFEREGHGAVRLPPHIRNPRAVVRTLELDDALAFDVEQNSEEALLMVSQQHHPHWRATGPGGERLETVVVNDFFQGVVVPPHTGTVRLEFKPHVRWSWLPNMVIVLVALVGLVARQRRRNFDARRPVRPLGRHRGG